MLQQPHPLKHFCFIALRENDKLEANIKFFPDNHKLLYEFAEYLSPYGVHLLEDLFTFKAPDHIWFSQWLPIASNQLMTRYELSKHYLSQYETYNTNREFYYNSLLKDIVCELHKNNMIATCHQKACANFTQYPLQYPTKQISRKQEILIALEDFLFFLSKHVTRLLITTISSQNILSYIHIFQPILKTISSTTVNLLFGRNESIRNVIELIKLLREHNLTELKLRYHDSTSNENYAQLLNAIIAPCKKHNGYEFDLSAFDDEFEDDFTSRKLFDDQQDDSAVLGSDSAFDNFQFTETVSSTNRIQLDSQLNKNNLFKRDFIDETIFPLNKKMKKNDTCSNVDLYDDALQPLPNKFIVNTLITKFTSMYLGIGCSSIFLPAFFNQLYLWKNLTHLTLSKLTCFEKLSEGLIQLADSGSLQYLSILDFGKDTIETALVYLCKPVCLMHDVKKCVLDRLVLHGTFSKSFLFALLNDDLTCSLVSNEKVKKAGFKNINYNKLIQSKSDNLLRKEESHKQERSAVKRSDSLQHIVEDEFNLMLTEEFDETHQSSLPLENAFPHDTLGVKGIELLGKSSKKTNVKDSCSLKFLKSLTIVANLPVENDFEDDIFSKNKTLEELLFQKEYYDDNDEEILKYAADHPLLKTLSLESMSTRLKGEPTPILKDVLSKSTIQLFQFTNCFNYGCLPVPNALSSSQITTFIWKSNGLDNHGLRMFSKILEDQKNLPKLLVLDLSENVFTVDSIYDFIDAVCLSSRDFHKLGLCSESFPITRLRSMSNDYQRLLQHVRLLTHTLNTVRDASDYVSQM